MTESKIPFLERAIVKEPHNYLQPYGGLQPLTAEESLDAASHLLETRRGSQNLLRGLILHGSTRDYNGVLGLDYSKFAKEPNFDVTLLGPVLTEMARGAQTSHFIIGVETSGTRIAKEVATRAVSPLLIVDKKGLFQEEYDYAERFAVQTPGFTKNEDNILSIGKDDFLTVIANTLNISIDKVRDLASQKRLDKLKMIFISVIDDIYHTGLVNSAVVNLLEAARAEFGLIFKINNIQSLFGMRYTDAYDKLVKLRAHPDAWVEIESLGLNPVPWLAVRGIDAALTYSNGR